MDDYKIALGALLDANAKGDIDKQLNAIKDLSVTISKATLSNDVINDIKRHLTQNGIDLKLVFGNVSQITNQAKQTGQQIGQQIQNGINDAIQKGNLQKDFFFSADKKNGVAKQAQEYFREISNGVVTVTEQMENLDGKSELRGFIVNIKNAKGEVESLKYSLRNILDDNGNVTGQKFAYVSGSINDAGAIKQFEELNKVITDYEIKLANLKTKYSNMNVDYSAFNDIFDNFKLGIGTTNDLALAFNQLENSAKKGVQSLKSQTSSFDPIQQTLNNMRDLPSMLTALEANMSGVKDKTSIAEISVDKLRESFDKLDAEMQSNGGKVPITDEWLKNYRDLMSTVTSATKQVDALKKAEASDNSQTQKQANYYSTILSNYREIYSLKQKLLTAGKEETKVIQEQIRSLNSSNASINKQLGKQGLKDIGWQSQVDDLKEELDYSLRISEARQKDKANQSSLNNAQREAIQIVEELEQAYQRVQDIKIKIASLDKAKDGEKISTLSQEEKTAQDEYNQLYNKLRKRKNYDKESWNETKNAIDAATKSQIEFNNAKSQDTLNKAQKTEVSNFNILKDKWEEQGVLVGEFKTKVEQMESALASVGSKGELDNLKLQIKDLKTEADKIAEVNKIQHSLSVGDYDAQVETIKKGFLSISGNADEAETHVKELRDAIKSMRDATDDNGILNAEKAYQLELEKTRNQLTISRAKAKEYVDSFKVNKLRNDIQDWLRKNTAATQDAKEAMKSYLNMLSSDKISPIDFNTIKNEFDNWDTQMRKAGRLGKSLTETFKEGAKSFAQWTISSGTVMEVWNTVRQGIQELKDLDDILTEISKTSDLTVSQLERLGNTAFESASKYGKTASDYLVGVQEMYRSGFSNASEMAEVSILAQAAGDMDSTLANDYLLATNAAYKYKGSVEDLTKVLNGQNYITNNAAISMKDIADATTETASVAAQYGVQIDELSALIATATANTRESGSEVGTALKAIMINLQDTTSKPVTETFDALGISMTKVVNGSQQLKTPIELIYELADAYNSLPEGDIMRANILNEIGQKRHANTLAAVLSDVESLDRMLGLYNSNLADNSAYNEAMKSANNWSGSLNKVRNSLNDLIQNFTESETIIGFLDIVNSLITGVDKLTESLGTLGTIALGGGIFAGFKSVDYLKMPVCPHHI